MKIKNHTSPLTDPLLISLFIIFSLFSTQISADILNGTHWIIKPGDSLYKIARNIFPNNTRQQARLRKELVSKNPQIFKSNSSNISVGDKLKLPDFAIKQNQPVIVKASKKQPPKAETAQSKAPVPTTQPLAEQAQIATIDPEDIIGQVIINVGSLSAQNRGSTRKLTRRSSIYRGDTLSTGERSLSQIRMKDGALLSLRPHTDIKIADYRYNGREDGNEQSILELLKGGFRTITGIIGHKNKQNYQVRTSVATIGIRGTHYSLVLCQQSSCSDDGADGVEDGLYGGVADGSIVIKNQTGTHRFNNDQFFKLASATSAPIEFLLPPAILKHGPAKLAGADKKAQQKIKQNISKHTKSEPRRLAIIFEANQPDFSNRPKIPVGDLNTPPIADFQPDIAPDGSGMLIGFQQLENTDGISGTAAPVVIAPNNNNQILLGPNRTPIAASEASFNPETGELVRHELVLASPNGDALAALVPSSVGGNPDLGVNWGRWNGDFTVLENGQRFSTEDNIHYIYSENLTSPKQLENLVQLANLGGLAGSASYNLVDGTLPTDHLGNVATDMPNINMNIDFITQEISSYDITNINLSGRNFQASASNIPFQDMSRGFFIQDISTGCASGFCEGEASVLFIGPEVEGAITSYYIGEPDGSAGVTGTGLLTKTPQ